MPILALDTSAGLAVAVIADGVVLARVFDPQPRRHAELLTPSIDSALRSAGCVPVDLERVVVGTGPAPFTGLRAGLVTARTFAYALGIPVDGVSSLDAIGLIALERFPDGEVLVVTDAKRHEVYWARYVSDPVTSIRLVAGPEVSREADLVLDGAVVVGRGPITIDPDPAALVRVALARLKEGLSNPTEPQYLRRPDAVPSAGKRRVSG